MPKKSHDTLVRESSLLTTRLIDQISNSVEVFRPSASLYALSQLNQEENVNISATKQPTEIDLVISGGGLKGYFACGAAAVLEQHLLNNNMRIARISGSSAGAWSALFILCGISTDVWIESYHWSAENMHRTIHDVYENVIWYEIQKHIPANAYQLCSGRLFISITYVNGFRLENAIISEFSSNEDLLHCCLASSMIPYVTAKSMYRIFRGRKTLDGGLTNNTPIFHDGVRRQLVFRLSEVEYPWRLLINPLDSCIDSLVLRGAMQMARFLSGERFITIQWLEKRQSEADLVKPNLLRRIVAPIAVTGFVIWRSIGFANIMDWLETLYAAKYQMTERFVPLDQAEKMFKESTPYYLVRSLYANLVSILASFNLLV